RRSWLVRASQRHGRRRSVRCRPRTRRNQTMIKHILLAAALAACGSKAPPPTKPTPPVETHDAVPDTKPAETKPTEAEKPAPPKSDPKADAPAAETAAYEKAKPAFEKACATCHTKAGKKSAKKKLDHFAMDTYPFGGHHTATIGFTIRDVLGI